MKSKRSNFNKRQKYIVAVPFLTSGFNFKIIRKNRWSIIDLLFLKRISNQDYNLDEISQYTNFKPQLVIQILLPMIKLGWIDIVSSGSNFIFRITEAGKSASKGSKLPDLIRDYISYRNIFVDLYGNYYGNHDLNFNPESSNRIAELKKSSDKRLIVLPVDNYEVYPDYEKMLTSVAYENEEAIDVDSFHYSISDSQFMLVNMIHSKGEETATIQDASILDGIDNRIKDLLENTLPDTNYQSGKKIIKDLISNIGGQDKKFRLNSSDVETVYGGIETKEAFLNLIRASTDYLIIHSTFIGEWRILDKKNNTYTYSFLEIKEALKRGVKVYILWGKDEPVEGDINYDKSRHEIENIEIILEKFRTECIAEGIQNVISYNSFKKTSSHAKFIMTNHSEKGNCTMISSCNFLYTEFLRFEASAIVYSEQFTKYFLNIAGDISTGRDLHTSQVREEIRVISSSITNKPFIINDYDYEIELSLVLKSEHYKYIDLAKKNARNRIYILSDRLNAVPERPIYDALKDSKATKNFYYSTRSKNLDSEKEVETIHSLKESANKINLIKHQHRDGKTVNGKEIRSHAKVLAWDNNDIVITSLNWLSSNASSDDNVNETYHEIGIHIKGRDISRDFIKQFRAY